MAAHLQSPKVKAVAVLSPPVIPAASRLVQQIDAEERRRLDATFDEMDLDNDGQVSTDEFTRFLSRNPRGWPLADFLDGQSAEMRTQMIQYWFRKLDCQSEGYFSKNELAAFFAALKVTEFRETFLADFLLNLFDVDLDGQLSRVELKRMLRVMLGHEPSEATVQHLCGRTQYVTRQELVNLLHEVKCEVGRIEASTAAKLGKSNVVDVIAIGVLVIGVAVGVALFLRRAPAHSKAPHH
jgi:Ca2+-binding EF-hand superfamily protein